MTTPLIEKLNITSSVSIVIISISLMLFGGFAMTRITKRLRLPNVTAYIVAGILMGPYCLNLIPIGLIERMDFIADIALAFIAFSTGEFFRFSTLKKSGVKVLLITFLEACLASIAVFIATHYVLGLDMVFSVVLAALASATAPASTMMTIRQTHAKGDFVDTLLQVVALDDVVGLVAYSIAISIALASMTGNFQAQNVLRPIIMNLFAFALGGVFGLILKFLLHKRSTDNRLIVSIALLFAFCGICALMGVSSLLGCMSMSMIYINISDDERLFKQLNYFSPPLLLLFFVRSGCYFQLLQSYRFGLFAGCRCGLLCHKNTRQIQRRLLGLPACRKEQKSSQQPWAGFNSTGGRCHWTGRDGSPHLGRCNGRRAGNNYPCLQRLVRTNRTCLRKIVAVPVGVVFQQVG